MEMSVLALLILTINSAYCYGKIKGDSDTLKSLKAVVELIVLIGMNCKDVTRWRILVSRNG